MNPKEFTSTKAGRVIKVHPAVGAGRRSVEGAYWSFVPNPLPPELQWTPQLVNAVSEADRALGELAGVGRSLANPHLLIRPFLHREAVLSSRIEGTQAGLADVFAYEGGQLPLFAPAQDVLEVYNYVRALEYGLERLKSLPLSLRFVCELHKVLMEGVRGERLTPGEFRRSQNWIGPPGSQLMDAAYVPPPVEEMNRALADLEMYLHRESDIPPVVRIGLIHYQFEAIHPFLDGNGRVGRLLISILLCAWGLLPAPLLYLSAYFESTRENYYNLLLKVSQRGDWDAWLRYFAKGVAEQSRDAAARARWLSDLRESYRQEIQTERSSARLLRLVDVLFERPVLTVTQVSSELDVDFGTASRYVKRLEERGVLREVSGRSRNRIYVADEVLRVVDAKVHTG